MHNSKPPHRSIDRKDVVVTKRARTTGNGRRAVLEQEWPALASLHTLDAGAVARTSDDIASPRVPRTR